MELLVFTPSTPLEPVGMHFLLYILSEVYRLCINACTHLDKTFRSSFMFSPHWEVKVRRVSCIDALEAKSERKGGRANFLLTICPVLETSRWKCSVPFHLLQKLNKKCPSSQGKNISSLVLILAHFQNCSNFHLEVETFKTEKLSSETKTFLSL